MEKTICTSAVISHETQAAGIKGGNYKSSNQHRTWNLQSFRLEILRNLLICVVFSRGVQNYVFNVSFKFNLL